ncbi:hypothetical protein, partial [Streptococcus suis]|uniref:hypothetical protein n=1 Tax=Streptococcus suis TaxID=1307 RepID=UPI001EE08FB4
REAFLFCPNSHYSGKKTDYQTNKQKKTNIKRDVCLHSELPTGSSHLQPKKVQKMNKRKVRLPTVPIYDLK